MSKLAHSDDASMAEIETQEIVFRERFKIRTSHTDGSWVAWFDGERERLQGRGADAVTAIQDLIVQFLAEKS